MAGEVIPLRPEPAREPPGEHSQADEQPNKAAGRKRERHKVPIIALVRELLGPVHRAAETLRRPRIMLRRLAVLTGLSVLGAWRLFGGWWRWVTAREYAGVDVAAVNLMTRMTLTEQVRQRRRRLSYFLAGVLTMASLYGWFWQRGYLYAVLVVLVATCTVLEAGFRRSRAAEAGRVALSTHPGSKAVRRAVSHAGLSKTPDDVRVVGPVTRDGTSWCAIVELPPGTPAKKAVTRRAELAGAVGVDIAQVFTDRVPGNEGRVLLQVFDHDPLSGEPVSSSLVTRTTPFDAWTEKVTVGVDVRSRPVSFSIIERSLLTGGEPGSGKSVGCNNVLCAMTLDTQVSMWTIDGKGGADLLDYEPISDRFLIEPDPDACLDLLIDGQDDMSDRYRKLRAIGAKKLTKEIATGLGLRLRVLHIDELQFFVSAGKTGDKIVDALWDLVSRGRAAGWVISCATQRPSGDVVPTKLRDILSIRWALRCTTPDASNTILGRGWAAKGYDASAIDPAQRGAGLLYAEGSHPITMRTQLLGDDEVTLICRRAYDLREKAGTLPMSDARPVVRLLKAVLRAFSETAPSLDKIFTTDLLAQLTQHADYADWDAERLATELRPVGVEPVQTRIGSVAGRKGYRLADVMRALERS
jgi:FtsK/SpoIIIE family